MPVTSPPKPTDFIGCMSWRSLQLRLNERAERELRELTGCLNHVDIAAEQRARRSPNPLVRQAFQRWQQTERDFAAADMLLEEATTLRAQNQLDNAIKTLDC